MHHPGTVYRDQRGGRSHREAVQVALGQRTPGVHAFLQRGAVNELADDKTPVARHRRLDDTGRDEWLDLVNGVQLLGQPLQDRGVHAGLQHLDRDPLLAGARAAAEVDHALAALTEPRQQLKPAQPDGIARLQRFRRHGLTPIRRQ